MSMDTQPTVENDAQYFKDLKYVKDFKFSAPEPAEKEPPSVTIVRLMTTWYKDVRGGLVVRKTLAPLKRRCTGYQVIYEDAEMIGIQEVLEQVTNLFQVEDGIYEVRTCNVTHHWESPHIIDDYQYELCPVEVVKA